MEKIKLDSGMREYRIGDGGVLRFNPADPNLYARFLACGEKLQAIETELTQKAKQAREEDLPGLSLLEEADRKLKAMLSWVFGTHNDFHEILGGVSLLARGGNGNRVIVNLLSALQPIMEEGAKICAQEESRKAVQKAQERRASQV